MERVLVSSCLLGEAVRYDGRDKRHDHPVLARWLAEGRVVSACPEVAGGLNVPRRRAEIEGGRGGDAVVAGAARVLDGSGADVTAEFRRGAEHTLALARAHGIRVAVLKERSPSCGSSATHDGSFSDLLVPRPGVTTALLRAAGIAVFSEAQIEDAERRLRRLEMGDPVIRTYTPGDLETLRALLALPGVREQFDSFQGDGALEVELQDEHLDREGIQLGFVDGVPAGFAFAYIMPQAGAGWAMARLAVAPEHRGRGIGELLLRRLLGHCASQTRVPDLRSVSLAAWAPLEAMAGLAAKLGFVEERRMWMLERPRGPVPAPTWPEGVEIRTYDGTERDLETWSDIHNESFAEHWRFVPSTAAECRALSQLPSFRPEGLSLAWKDGTCVGYCGALLFEERGEIAALGTACAVRGTGVGRALLRAGVAWLEKNTPHPITLVVDGENDGALKLYRSEGFVTMRERRIWNLPADRLAALAR